MAEKRPDWHWFLSFLAVVREGSLSRAARVLGTTQPTMIPSAEAMAAAVEAAQRSASGASEEERGTVRITASEIIGSEVLPPILAEFHALNPRLAQQPPDPALFRSLGDVLVDVHRRQLPCEVSHHGLRAAPRGLEPAIGACNAGRFDAIDCGQFLRGLVQIVADRAR
jgi:DNA-binding transcriptional LysR family regulator